MSRKGARQLVFVCAGIIDGELITKIIPAVSQNEASEVFTKQFLHAPQDILGPFLKKKTQVIETTRILKFSNQTKKAIYGDWMVNAFMLTDPADWAFLVFIKRTDDKKMSFPKGTITVPIADLRFI
jgi:hypothetical protein